MRDQHSGKLTEYGRQLLKDGKEKCRVQDILEPRALTRDPMDLPFCSYEWESLARLLVYISKLLNTQLKLPQDNQQIMCSWKIIFQRARKLQPPGDYFYTLRIAKTCFRFNLRCFASYRVFSALLGVTLALLYRMAILSVPVTTVVAIILALVAFNNGIYLR